MEHIPSRSFCERRSVQSNPAQFANGYTHTGDNSTETSITPANVFTLNSKFTTVPLSATGGDFIDGEAAIANGVMYVSGADGTLHAYDASGSNGCSGTPTACAAMGGLPGGAVGLAETTAAVAYGVVYVASSVGVRDPATFEGYGKECPQSRCPRIAIGALISRRISTGSNY